MFHNKKEFYEKTMDKYSKKIKIKPYKKGKKGAKK
jgi:hypothetical protein